VKSVLKIFQKPTKICDQCGAILKKNDPAVCLHGVDNSLEFEIFICEPCCEKIAFEYDADHGMEEINATEDRDDYP
jgi:hypothetical protein